MRSVARVARRRLSTAAAPPLRAMLEGFSAPTVSNAAAALDGLLPPSWMQGATTYGGCSSALCLVGARALEANMPLRSAMVSFVGPAGGHVSVDASVVRSGRSSTVVRSDLIGAKGVATAASFTFAQSRPSAMEEKRFLPPPPNDLLPPDACPTYPDVIGLPMPTFFQHFEARLASRGQLDSTAPGGTHNWLWVRHAQASGDGGVDGVDADVALLALADMPPPAILPLLPTGSITKFPNVSSLTWQVNFLCDVLPLAHPGGWWLIQQRIEHLHNGYSSCDMALWGADPARPPVVSRQQIAVYM